MSQHFFDTQFGQWKLRVQMGWDKPLQLFYCDVYRLKESKSVTEVVLYSHLNESDHKQCNLDHFIDVLWELFDIKLPEDMIECVKQDTQYNIVNRGPLLHDVNSSHSESFWI